MIRIQFIRFTLYIRMIDVSCNIMYEVIYIIICERYARIIRIRMILTHPTHTTASALNLFLSLSNIPLAIQILYLPLALIINPKLQAI